MRALRRMWWRLRLFFAPARHKLPAAGMEPTRELTLPRQTIADIFNFDPDNIFERE
jgi:hypothetical protein